MNKKTAKKKKKTKPTKGLASKQKPKKPTWDTKSRWESDDLGSSYGG